MVLVHLLQMQERLLGLLQDVFPPVEQLQAEIVPLPLVHERLLVGRLISLGFSSGQHPTHSLASFVLAATICPRAAGLYTRAKPRTTSEWSCPDCRIYMTVQ